MSLAVKRPQNPLYSVSSLGMHGKKVVSSTVILEMQAAWNLPSTTVSTVAVAQFTMPIKLSSYATWSAMRQ